MQHDDCLELPLTFLPPWASRPECYFGQRLLAAASQTSSDQPSANDMLWQHGVYPPQPLL